MMIKKKVLAFFLAVSMTMSTWIVNVPMNQVHAEELPEEEISAEVSGDMYESEESSEETIPEEPQFPEEPQLPEEPQFQEDPDISVTEESPDSDQVHREEALKEADGTAVFVKLKNISVESGKDISSVHTPDNFVAKLEMEIPEELYEYSLVLSYWNKTTGREYIFKSEMGKADDVREVNIDLHKYYPKGNYILRSVRMDGMAHSVGANVMNLDYVNAAFYEGDNQNCLFMSHEGERVHELPYNGELDFSITDSPALTDTSFPEVTSIELASGKALGSRSEVEFLVNYTEEGSGIKKIWIQIDGENGGSEELTAWADEVEQWEGKGTISVKSSEGRYRQKGRYHVSNIRVEDYVGNYTDYYEEKGREGVLVGHNADGGESLLDITGCSFDVQPIEVLKSLKIAGNIKKDQMTAGDSFEITATICNSATENALVSPTSSGITWDTGESVRGVGEPFILKPGEEAEIMFPVKMNSFGDKGSRKVNSITIAEQSGSVTFMRVQNQLSTDGVLWVNEWMGNEVADLPYEGEVDYTITKADTPDQEAPYIEEISVVTKNIKSPGKVSFEIKVSEGHAKMTSFLPVFEDTENPDNTLMYQSKGWVKNKFESELTYSKEKKCYLYTIDLPVSAIKGEYILANVSVYDEAGNSRYYKIENGELVDTENAENKCAACKMVIAQAESSDRDFTNPVLEEFELMNNEVQAGDQLQIKIQAAEESGLSLVTVRWISSRWETISVDSTEIVSTEDGYLCKFKMDQYCREGDFTLYDVMLMDDSVRTNLQYFTYDAETSSFRGLPDSRVIGSADLHVTQVENTVIMNSDSNNEKDVLDTAAQGGTVVIQTEDGLTGTVSPATLSADLLNTAREKELTVIIHNRDADLVIDGKSIPETITESVFLQILRQSMKEEAIAIGDTMDDIYYPIEITTSNTNLPITIRVKVEKDFVEKCGEKGIRFSRKNQDDSTAVIAKDLDVDADGYVEVKLPKGWNPSSGQGRAIMTEKIQFFISAESGGYQLGDINNDKKVNLTDLMMCLNHVAKKTELTGDALRAADIDGNGGVTLSDLMRLLNYVSKKTDKL